jgi:2-polyprenyl-6-methoxyphenol hydroxylase-like FAD-dependent oxidoreductase
MDSFDVAIIGGGPAGCAAALSIRKNAPSLTCIVIDDADPEMFKVGESLPPESGRLLHYLDASLMKIMSSRVTSGVHTPCSGNASAWASSQIEERHSIMNPFGQGHHLNRANFDEMLRSAVDRRPSTMLKKGKFISVHKRDDGKWIIDLDVDGSRKSIEVTWVVDATGRKASVATKIGAKVITSKPLLAFYAVFTAQDAEIGAGDNDLRTLIEATASGWWYSSLVSRNPPTRVVVLHTLPTHPTAKLVRRAEGFLEHLKASSTHVSAIVDKWEYEMENKYPRCTAAGSSYLDKPCDGAAHWVAVGDAAMAFDPLSSQGVMTALEMGSYAGLHLSNVLMGKEEESQLQDVLENAYGKVVSEYEKHRGYYYSIVKRFPGELFWGTT